MLQDIHVFLLKMLINRTSPLGRAKKYYSFHLEIVYTFAMVIALWNGYITYFDTDGVFFEVKLNWTCNRLGFSSKILEEWT